MFYAHMSAKNGVFAVCPVTYNHQKSLLTNYHTKSCIHLLSHFVKYGRIFIGQCRQYGDSSLVALFGDGKGSIMDTLEVLTLLLVIFAALSYIDNHSNRK